MTPETVFPRGYLLELDKFLRLPHDRLDRYKELLKQYKQKYGVDVKRATAFGDFDLIGIQTINSFPEYRQNSSRSYTWLGNQQSILLTPIRENEYRKFSYFEAAQKHGLNLSINGEEIATPFFGVTLLYVSSMTRTRLKSYNKFLEYCQDSIERIVDEYNSFTNAGITCEVYSTFHFAEIAILWAANQFVDILSLVEKIRDLNFQFGENDSLRVFNSSYSVVSLLRCNVSNENKNLFKGEALIQCSIKETGGDRRKKDEEIARFVQAIHNASKTNSKNGEPSLEEDVKYCAGGLDLLFSVDIATLYSIFTSKDIAGRSFYNFNPEFQQNVEKTVTRLCFTEKDVAPHFKDIPWDSLTEIEIDNSDIDSGILEFALDDHFSCSGNNNKTGIDRKFSQIRKKFLELCPLMSGILSTFDLLYSDYVQCVSGANDDFWLNDFQTQFSSLLDIIDRATDHFMRKEGNSNNLSPDLYLKTLQRLFSVFSAQMNHITDAGRPSIDVTRSHFSGMEQVDLTLHAYYGIVKDVLYTIYTNAGKNQSPLVPVISLEPMSRVSSVLYYDEPTDGTSPTRLINIELPYDVWSFFHYHIPLIVHELYHYTAPLSRGLRNYTVGILLIYRIVCDTVEELAKKVWAKAKSANPANASKSLGQLRSLLCEEIWDFLQSKGDALSNSIPGMDYNDSSACVMAQFSSNLYAWVYGEGNSDSTSYSMAVLWKELIVFLGANSEELAQDADDKNIVLDLLKALQDTLSDFAIAAEAYDHCASGEQSNEPSSMLYIYDNLIEEQVISTREYYGVQIYELLPDLAMVTLLNMNPEEYLAQFAIFQDNSLRTPSDVSERHYLAVRLGVVLDWLLAKLEPIDGNELLQRFQNRKEPFIELYNNAHGGKNEERGSNQEKALAWFGAYDVLFRYYINNFTVERKWMHSYVSKQIMPLLRNPNTRIREITHQYYQHLRSSSIDSGLHFTHVITSIRWLQKQPLLHELNQQLIENQAVDSDHQELCNEAVSSLKRLWSPRENKPFSINTAEIGFDCPNCTDRQGRPLQVRLYEEQQFYAQLNMLTTCMQRAHEDKFQQQLASRMLWFRGVKDQKYHLLPSILVNFLKENGISDEKNFDPDNWKYETVHALQREKYEGFKYRADGAPEMISEHRYTKIDYLALMQHYGQLTTLLDWSEDAFSSLYFALEPHFKNDPTACEIDAALYLFDPEMYNTARLEIMAHLNYSKPTIDKGKASTRIPNLSIPYNEKTFSEFICSDAFPASTKTHMDISKDPRDATLEDLKAANSFQLPLAIYTSQISRRIRAQSGIFLAYSPETMPLINHELMSNLSALPSSVFDYIALDTIQKYYLNTKAFKNAYPFLRKMIIKGQCAKQVTKLLKNLGINRYRIYPELEELE